MENTKLGNFDWILSFEQLSKFLSRDYINFDHTKYSNCQILVSGCGTSTLSYDLIQFGFNKVISIDNDIGCIKHCRDMYKNYSQLEWYCYDITGLECNEDFDFIPNWESYDIIIDKGTLDAILVGGTVSSTLINIYRLLKPVNGIYLLCSLFSHEYIHSLLLIPELGFNSVKHFELESKDNNPSNIYLCFKVNSNVNLDIDIIMEKETEIMNSYFQDLNPFLTNQKEEEIRTIFGNHKTMSVNEVYDQIFAGYDELGYTFDLFQADLMDFKLSVNGYFSLEELLEFLRTKQ